MRPPVPVPLSSTRCSMLVVSTRPWSAPSARLGTSRICEEEPSGTSVESRAGGLLRVDFHAGSLGESIAEVRADEMLDWKVSLCCSSSEIVKSVVELLSVLFARDQFNCSSGDADDVLPGDLLKDSLTPETIFQ